MSAFPFDVGADIFSVADGTETVTVRQINPDSGATLATAPDVPCFAPDFRKDSDGSDEVGSSTRDVHLLASAMSFAPKARDQFTRADGVVWIIGTVEVVAFGTLIRCAGCVRKR